MTVDGAPGQTRDGKGSTPARRAPTISGRLARILTLPLVAVVVLLAVVVVGDVSDYRIASATKGAVDLDLSVQDLVQELQLERGLTSGLLGGDVGFRGEIDPARRRVDDTRAQVGHLTGRGARGAAEVRVALRGLDDLATVRAQVDAGKAGRAATFQYFTGRIAALNGVDYGLDRSPDPTLRRGVAALDALGDVKEQTSQERAFLNGVFSAGGFARDEFLQYAGINAAQQAALAQFARYATPARRAQNDLVLDSGAAREAAHFEQIATGANDGRLLQVNPQSWWSALTTVIDGTREVQQASGADIQRRARKLQSDASRRLGILLGLVVLCVAGALGLVVAATRSITRPLNALAAEADNVATVRLPEAVARAQAGGAELPAPPEPVRVPQGASAEIHSVAATLDRVQATAYSLATEQALLRRTTTESLANLGRRNQNLLRRQLGFISRLEREESDPSGLANLFELDHLATRMRRNAESLLVLVGESSPRQWSAPLPVADVIRAAISEVEEYRRVSLRRIDEAYVGGAYVTGLAHMIAELVENGLTFSPPDVDVEIQGRQLGGHYLIAVVDQGVGMEPEDLTRANARLRGEESFLSAPARYLGHYVVGQLARQMSVDVQMAPSPVTGVTARVMLPAGLLARPPAIDPAHVEIVDRGRDRAAPQWAIDARRPSGVEFIAVPATQVTERPGDPVRAIASAVPSPDSGTPGAVPERTRNGLVKRVPRSRAGQLQPQPPVAGRSEQPAPVDRPPSDVRTTLTSLRAGVQRGENARSRGVTGAHVVLDRSADAEGEARDR